LLRLRERTGLSAVLSLQHEQCLAQWDIDYGALERYGTHLGLQMVRCPMRDFDSLDQRRRLPAAVAALARLCADGQRVYVHCTAGLGRSPLTLLGYLTLVEGRTPQEAIALIERVRPGAVPSWEAYYGCRQDLVERCRPLIAARAYAIFQVQMNPNAEADWLQAETEVLRELLLQMAGVAPDPMRSC
jgi:hypothetical protein